MGAVDDRAQLERANQVLARATRLVACAKKVEATRKQAQQHAHDARKQAGKAMPPARKQETKTVVPKWYTPPGTSPSKKKQGKAKSTAPPRRKFQGSRGKRRSPSSEALWHMCSEEY